MSELWDVYLQPTDATNLEECKQVDKYNESVWMKNNQNLPKINELLTKMGLPAYRLIAAPKYYPSAYNAWRKSINDPSTKTLHATQYLFKHTAQLPFRDYQLQDAAVLADAHAEKEYIRQQCDAGPIDVTQILGTAHANNCTCNNKWDGRSERCMGQGPRLRWERQPTHHFLEPCVRPNSW